MIDDPVLAIAVSARDWPDRVRRSLADHGGARVRVTALAALDLEDEDYDVLLIDDISSFLTRGLVTDEHRRGRSIVGIFDPAEPAGREHLLGLGVDRVVAADSSADDIVAAARGVATRTERPTPPAVAQPEPSATGSLVAIRGVSGGVGVTEIAFGLGCELREAAVVVELAAMPSLAQRTSCSVHPNLVTAAESLEHGSGDVAGAVQAVGGGAEVLVGPPGGVRPVDSRRVITHLRAWREWTIVDLGAGAASDRLPEPDAGVVVTTADPVGLARCIEALRQRDLSDTHVVLNRAARGAYTRAELTAALEAEIRPRSVTVLPADRQMAGAAWNGHPVRGGAFRRGVRHLAAVLGVEA